MYFLQALKMLFKVVFFSSFYIAIVNTFSPDIDSFKERPPYCNVPGSSQMKPECGASTSPNPKSTPTTNTPAATTKLTKATSTPTTTQSVQDNNGVSISYDEFRNAVESNGGEPGDNYPYYMNEMSRGHINTKEEAAMLLAHSIHETGGLRLVRESACQTDMESCRKAYKNDCDLLGRIYYGRGFLQLTWCYNYEPASQAIFGDRRLYENPELAADDITTAWATAFWYWGRAVHDFGGSTFEFGRTTRAINGDKECNGGENEKQARHRFEIYTKIRQAYGLSGPPKENGCYNDAQDEIHPKATRHNIEVANNCQEVIWVGIFAENDEIPLNGGFQLNPSQSITFDVRKGWTGGRVWGRTGCDNSGANCETGDCGAGQCNGKRTTRTAVTLAEFGLDSEFMGLDFYDISQVDGFNIPMSINPLGVEYGDRCRKLYCNFDFNACPNDPGFKIIKSKGIVGCNSACSATQKDEYCCPKDKGYNEDNCKPSDYSRIFKQQCPDAFSYAFDTKTSDFACKANGPEPTAYQVTFCP